MKNSRKMIALVLAIAVMASIVLTACGSAATTTAATTKATSAAATSAAATTAAAGTTAAAKGKTFGFSVKTLTNPFFVKIKDALEANKKAGDTILTLDSQNDVNKELANVEDLISKKVDGIFITCMDINGSVNSINKILAAGIKVAILDSPSANRDKATFSVISDNVLAGYLAMKALDEALPDGAEIVIFENSTSAAVSDRMKGRDQYLTEHPAAVKIGNRKNDKGSIDTGFAAMNDFLQSNPKATGVWAMNDPSAQGIISAIKAAGKKAGDIKVVAIDGSAESAKLIADGWQLGSSAQYPTTIGKTAIEEMYKVLAGGQPSKQDIRIATEWIDSKNIANYKAYNMQ